jgi:hypothetical protein
MDSNEAFTSRALRRIKGHGREHATRLSALLKHVQQAMVIIIIIINIIVVVIVVIVATIAIIHAHLASLPITSPFTITKSSGFMLTPRHQQAHLIGEAMYTMQCELERTCQSRKCRLSGKCSLTMHIYERPGWPLLRVFRNLQPTTFRTFSLASHSYFAKIPAADIAADYKEPRTRPLDMSKHTAANIFDENKEDQGTLRGQAARAGCRAARAACRRSGAGGVQPLIGLDACKPVAKAQPCMMHLTLATAVCAVRSTERQ